MKLPFKIPFVGEKTKLTWTSYEDDVFKEQYMLKISGEFPENVVKALYDLVLKKKLGTNFKVGLLDDSSVDVPSGFFEQKIGFITWEDVLLKQLERVFADVRVKCKWLLVTKHIKAMQIRRHRNTYFVTFEIIGQKTSAMRR
jgi:hypothetical protein